jgi:hypothetical protein
VTTPEEAFLCPKCSKTGVEVKKTKGPQGSTIFNVNCDNPLCLWYETGWIVQIKADGTVAERKQGEKEFAFTAGDAMIGKSFVDRLRSELERGELPANG